MMDLGRAGGAYSAFADISRQGQHGRSHEVALSVPSCDKDKRRHGCDMAKLISFYRRAWGGKKKGLTDQSGSTSEEDVLGFDFSVELAIH